MTHSGLTSSSNSSGSQSSIEEEGTATETDHSSVLASSSTTIIDAEATAARVVPESALTLAQESTSALPVHALTLPRVPVRPVPLSISGSGARHDSPSMPLSSSGNAPETISAVTTATAIDKPAAASAIDKPPEVEVMRPRAAAHSVAPPPVRPVALTTPVEGNRPR